MPGIVAPDSFPTRSPKETKQVSGRIVNHPNYVGLGGLDGPGKLPNGNEMRIEKPTDVTVAHKSRKNED